MGRKLRETGAGIYHVAARAAVGALLFRDEHDYLRFEAEAERIGSSGCVCIAACAIDTHYHLLLQTEDGVLNRVMQRLNRAYSSAFNARYGRRSSLSSSTAQSSVCANSSRRPGRATAVVDPLVRQ
jgi:hypothetical protein